MAGAGHKVHGKKPLGESGAGFVKDGAGARIDMMAAFLTGVSLAGVHRVEAGLLYTAAGASDFRAAIIDFHELGQARRIVWIFALKLFEGVSGHNRYPNCY